MRGIICANFVQLVDQVSVRLPAEAFLAYLREDERVLTLLLHEVCKLALASLLLLHLLILTALDYVVMLIVSVYHLLSLVSIGEIWGRFCYFAAFGDCRIQILFKF